MPRQPQAASYAALLRLDGVLPAFAAATAGRLSYAMISLALLLTVTDATGSYAAAGLALGGYALTSLLMPFKSRLIDRRGAATVLPRLSAGMCGCLLVVALLASVGARTGGPYVVLAVATGLLAPPLGPSMRAIWAAVTPDTGWRRRAYSLDGVVEEVLYATGPLLVGAILLVASSPVLAVVTGVLNLVGTLALVGSAASRRHTRPHADPATPTHWTGPLTRPGFGVLLVVGVGVGLGGGPLEVALVARAREFGPSAGVGYLLAALSVGGAVGGLLWGRLALPHRPRRHLAASVAAAAVVTAALVPTTDLLGVAGLLFVMGLVSSPLLITAYLAADDLVPEEQQREASTWVNTVNNVGVALGAATAGVLVDHGGPGPAFTTGAVLYTASFLVVLGLGGRLTPPSAVVDGPG